MLLAPVVREQKGEFRDVVERLSREGFVRARIDGELVELANGVRVKLDPKEKHTIEAVVDRLVIDERSGSASVIRSKPHSSGAEGRADVLHQSRTRVQSQSPEAVRTSLALNRSQQSRQAHFRGSRPSAASRHRLGRDTAFEPQLQSGHRQELRAADPQAFLLQCARGRMPGLPRLGQKMVFDEGPGGADPEKSLEQGAILPWRRGGKRMVVYYKSLLRGVAAHYQQSLETPYEDCRRISSASCWGSGRRRSSSPSGAPAR